MGKEVWARYVTHLIHLEGEGVPGVDKEELGRWGVECVRLYGRKAEDGTARYDGRAVRIFFFLGNSSSAYAERLSLFDTFFVRVVSLLGLLL